MHTPRRESLLNLPLPRDFDLDGASPAVRRFLHDFFSHPVNVLRGEADLGYLKSLTGSEREQLRALLRLHLRPLNSAVLEAVGLLPAPELESDLAQMLHEVDDLSWQLGIARNLVRITGDPGSIRKYLHRMRASRDANLKEAHFGDIRFLPPNEQLDFYFDLLHDPDSPFVRHQALRELNELHDRKHYGKGPFPNDAAHFESRRDDPRFRAKLVEGLAADRSSWGA